MINRRLPLQKVGNKRIQCQICKVGSGVSKKISPREKGSPVRIPLQGQLVGVGATEALAGDVGRLRGCVCSCRRRHHKKESRDEKAPEVHGRCGKDAIHLRGP